MKLKERLKNCFSHHIKVSSIFGHHCIILLLIVHLLIGFRLLREVDYYRDDPIVLRLLGLRRLPDTSTISRALCQIEVEGVDNYRQLLRELVIYDGSQSVQGNSNDFGSSRQTRLAKTAGSMEI